LWDLILNYFIRIGQYPRAVVTVELLLIGLIVYWVVNFIEGTRGERLFRGVIFVLFAGTLTLNLVVRRYQFDRLEFLYKGFLIAILIIAVAAFQPEIRRALIRIGQTKWLGGASHQLSRTVEEIIAAVTSLSKSRIGAIIVIEQQVGLREFIESGVRLDSKVTADLLKTIFYPGTPLHDMAVVIQGDRLIAARVQLPLAELGAIEDGNLGSRHRAAIGITAGTDATVIVVSEETGIISLALNGTLTRGIPEEQLRKHLTAGLVEKAAIVQTLKDQENQLAETPDEKENS
jgi:diadenylate cyclase